MSGFQELDNIASQIVAGEGALQVDVGVVSGELQATMRGRFVAGPRGLVFVNEDRAETEASPG